MIYKVSRNRRKGLGYVPPKDEKPYSEVDDMVIKYTPLKSHFTYGHPHDINILVNHIMQNLMVNLSSNRTLENLTKKDPKRYGYLRRK